MKVLVSFVLAFMMSNAACFQHSKRHTVELGCHLYVEDFEVNHFGVDEVYLTDSLRFRAFVGKYDVEHERFTFLCKDDSLAIYKKIKSKGVWKKVDSLVLSRNDLTNTRIDSTKPLFKIR